MIACRVPASKPRAAMIGAVGLHARRGGPWAALVSGGPAAAQFGGIFGGDQPPRPPSAVPGRPQAPPQPPPQAGLAAVQSGHAAAAGSAAAPGRAESRARICRRRRAPRSRRRGRSLRRCRGPVRRPRLSRPGRASARSGAAAAPPDDVVTQPPTQKIVNPKAVFSGLDKITGRITTFDAAIGETVQFGALQVTTRACYTRPPTETPLTDGFVEVDEVTLQGEVRRIFTGWMFAASPGLHGVEHAIYDVWLTDCKGGAQAVAEAPPPPPPPVAAPAARPPAQPRAPAPHDPAAAPAPDRRRAAAAADPLRSDKP